jgi:hypothetical protein
VTIAAAAPHPVHIHKPWRQSTGPRTARGKAISRMNALKHGRRSAAVMAERRAVKHYLRVQAEFLKQVRQLLRLQRSGVIKQQGLKSTNELSRSLFVSAHFKSLQTPQIIFFRSAYSSCMVERCPRASLTSRLSISAALKN